MEPPSPRASLLVRGLALGVTLAFTAMVLRFIAQNGWFVGDDYYGFWLARTVPLRESVWVPVGSQVVPLHRVVDFLVYHLAPMRYAVSVALLVVLHVAGLYHLHGALDLLRRSWINVVLVALYATFVHLWIELAWWTPGLQRIPFAALSFVALRAWLRHSRDGRSRDLAVFCGAVLLALGFYGKAVLIPVACLALDYARGDPAPKDAGKQTDARVRFVACGALVVASLAFIVVARAMSGETSTWGATDLGVQIQFLSLSLVIFAHALPGLVLHFPAYDPSVAIGFAWALLISYSVFRAPRALRAWAAGAVVLCLHVLVIGLSKRTLLGGALMAFEGRYQFDLMAAAVPFLAAALHRIPASAPEVRWVGSLGRGWVWPGAVGAALALQGVVSHANFSASAFEYSTDMPTTRRYMLNLTSDLERLERGSGPPPRVSDGPIPMHVNAFDFVVRRQSQLFLVLNARAEVVPRGDYVVAADGHLVPAGRPAP